jgi:general secretion pathway protein G
MKIARAEAGFSLIEIIVAVTIMAIVAALVVPNVWNYMKTAKKKTTGIALSSVSEAIQTFQSDTGTYPATIGDLITKPVDAKIAGRWEGPYLKNEPRDGWGNDLVYTLNPKGTQPPFELYSWGSHGEGSPQEEWIRARDI